MGKEEMSRDTALKLLKGIKNYLTTGNPIWDTQDIEYAMDAAIKAFENQQELADATNEIYAKGYNAAKREIALSGEYERAYQRGKADATKWIPCSDRLPENIRPVLVTWKNNDPESYYQYIVGKHFIGAAHYHRGKWHWYSSVTEDLLAEYGKCETEEFDEAIEVVAWMPLPEPYNAESEGEDDRN